MRELTFTLRERLVLIPVELVLVLRSIAVFGGGLFLLTTALYGPVSGLQGFIAYLGAVVTGIVVAPILLPWLPGRSFSLKGAFAGLVWSATWYFLANGTSWDWPTTAATFLALPAVSAWYTLNFTGCTTYTSRSGVKKEMRYALPAMGCALVISGLLVLAEKLR
jgi:acetyl-CoA decarbonylase/synthase complex subunit gamma